MKHTVTTKGQVIEFDSPYTDAQALQQLRELTFSGKLTSSFAHDLANARFLSEKQWHWVHRLVTQTGERKTRDGIDLSGVVALFNKAHERGLTRVALRVDLGAPFPPVKLTLAGPSARVPGSVNVKASDHDEWYGRIHTDGKLELVRESQELVALLVMLADDPVGVARQHGARTCHCCFCGRQLDTLESTAVGYGPICADKFGLPWGETAVTS